MPLVLAFRLNDAPVYICDDPETRRHIARILAQNAQARADMTLLQPAPTVLELPAPAPVRVDVSSP